MKKIVFSIFIIITLILNFNQPVSIGANDTSFVSEAFKATDEFFNEKVEDDDGRITDVFNLIKKIIKAINRVLIIVLGALSMISLAMIGIKYIMSSTTAGRLSEAKKQLKTVVIGMAFGFGAYTIWMIGIYIVEIIIEQLK